MDEIEDYEILETLYDGKETVIKKIRSVINFETRIIKYLKSTNNKSKIIHLENEAKILEQIKNVDGVTRLINNNLKDQTPHLILDFKGESLNEIINKKGQDFHLMEVLKIVKELAQILRAIHEKNIIHKDISIGNVLFDFNSRKTSLIDFDIATPFKKNQGELTANEELQGTLPFISPEQTGRIGKDIDYRSDLYSLGILFYFLIHHKYPFKGDDKLTLIHQHIATQAPSLIEGKEGIPTKLDLIFQKLVEKDPDNRYQSHSALINDLEYFINNSDNNEKLNSFSLSINDRSPLFRLPQKIYGRENEIAKLEYILETHKESKERLVLIKGPSGIGKSSFISHFNSVIIKKRGIVLSSKFDQFINSSPYFALKEILNQFIKSIHFIPQGVVQKIKNDILKEKNIRISELKKIVPKLNELFKDVKQNETEEVEGIVDLSFHFQKVIEIISTHLSPLILIVDDLQWADGGSIDVIKNTILSDKSENILFLCLFRDNEIKENHFFNKMLKSIQEKKKEYLSIDIGPLKEEHIEQLLMDMFKVNRERIGELSKIIAQKTLGNPFYVNQFLNDLYSDKIITFNFELGEWGFDKIEIKNRSISENVADYLTKKIELASHDVKEFISICSLIGQIFDVIEVSKIMGIDLSSVAKIIKDGEVSDFISPFDDNSIYLDNEYGIQQAKSEPHLKILYKFNHDRIQFSFSKILDQTELEQWHKKIGDFLYQKKQDKKSDVSVFIIISHYQFCKNNETIIKEIEPLYIELLLQSIKEAYHKGAYDNATIHIEELEKIDDFDKKINEKDAFNYYFFSSSNLLSLKRPQQALDMIFVGLEKWSFNKHKKAKLYNLALSAYTYLGKYKESYEMTLVTSKLIGPSLNRFTIPFRLVSIIIKLYFMLRGNLLPKLSSLEKSNDPVIEERMSFLYNAFFGCYFYKPIVGIYVHLQTVLITLKNGKTSHYPIVASSLVLLSTAFSRKLTLVKGLFNLSIKAISESQNEKVKALSMAFLSATRPLYELPKETEEAMDELEELAHRIDENLISDMYKDGEGHYSVHFSNQTIDTSEEKIRKYQEKNIGESVNELTQDDLILQTYLSKIHQSPIVNLRFDIVNKILNINASEEDVKKNFFPFAKNSLNLYKTFLCYQVGNFKEGKKYSRYYEKYKKTFISGSHYLNYCLVSILNDLELYEKSGIIDKMLIKKAFKKRMKDFKKFNTVAVNPYFKYAETLCNAKFCFVTKKLEQAKSLYDLLKIKQNEISSYIMRHIFLGELINFYLKNFYIVEAKNLYREASMNIQNYGASGLLTELKRKFECLEKDLKESYRNDSSGIDTETIISVTSKSSRFLDWTSISKSYQAISEEIHIEKLLQKILSILIENAGAEIGAIMTLSESNSIQLRAIGSSKSKEIYAELKDIPAIESRKDLCIETIQYVANSKRNLILQDACHEGDFRFNQYIKDKGVKSLLCMPIQYQNRTVAILYLENNLTSYTFTPKRIETLQFLSVQAAISLENAILYSTLEDRVKERTEELRVTQKKMLDIAHKAGMSEVAAEVLHKIGNEMVKINLRQEELKDSFSETFKNLNVQIKLCEKHKDIAPPEFYDLQDKMFTSFKAIRESFENLEFEYKTISNIIGTQNKYVENRQQFFQEINLLETLKEELRDIIIRINEEGIQVYWDIPEKLIINVEKNKFILAMEAIIKNSYEALKDVSGEKSKKIFISAVASEQTKTVSITVEDTGGGVPKEDFSKIFRMGYTTKKFSEGNGLHDASNYISSMKGIVSVDSPQDSGLILTIKLPYAK